MSENIIYCYSGSGHCLDMAKSIAKVLGDTDIVMMRSFPTKTDAGEAKRVGFVFPCYGGGLPGDVENYVKAIRIKPDAYKFAVEQYAGYMGCGLHKIDEIVGLDYWDTVSNHSTCIWLMPHSLTFPPTSKELAQKRLDKKAEAVGKAVKAMERSEKKPPKKAVFALESKAFSGMHAARTKKFSVGDACIGCGTCVKVCPRNNISLTNGRPNFGTNCIGCLSCVQYCPEQAINVGKITEKRERFPNPHIMASDLTQKIIHID
ncbi:MAG: EFR1 family ferrodoxin [Oscillospiraceae bacterium]|nr:EFR1 family ferrodoxin [Oscillospiraceae bacterium]